MQISNDVKTLIEIFDGCQIENVVAGLRFRPEKIIFIGYKNVVRDDKKRAIESLFRQKSMEVDIEYEIVSRFDYNLVVERLNDILDRSNGAFFDITGGKDMILTAIGEVAHVRSVPVIQLNVITGQFIPVKNCEQISDYPKSSLTISECVAVNGCSVIHNYPEDFPWDFNDEFKKDIEIMWSLCKRNCGLWNRESLVFESFEKYGSIDDTLLVKANLKYMKDHNADILLVKSFIDYLLKNHLISDYKNDGETVEFRYKNPQIRRAISKAGNILELYTYVLINEISEENPLWYDDTDIGVYIDWDGVIHSDEERCYDTKNEIDILLTRDLVPVFISCKNGEIHKEALYELETVADRFGGRYARKFLVASYISTNEESRKYIIQRAKDMNINLICDVHSLTRDGFKTLLKKNIK